MKCIIFTALMLICSTAQAKFAPANFGVAGEMLDLHNSNFIEKIDGSLVPVNDMQTGLKVTPIIHVDNGINYHLIGVYSGVTVSGLNVSQHRDVVAVQGTVIKNSADAHVVGLKCGIYDAIAGGSSTCLSIDYPLPLAGTPTAGITFQGSTFATGLQGIKFLNPSSYETAIDLDGAKIAMGRKNGSNYCLKFNSVTAGLDYVRDCGTPSESVVGRVSLASPLLGK